MSSTRPTTATTAQGAFVLEAHPCFSIQVALKKGSSIEYVWINQAELGNALASLASHSIFTEFRRTAFSSIEIELPLNECPRYLGTFGHLTRKDVDLGDIFFDVDKVKNCEAPQIGVPTSGASIGSVILPGVANDITF